MYLTLHPKNPENRHIETIKKCLLDGGVIIYPTDTVYGLGCNIFNQKAIEKICSIKKIKAEKSQFSFVCADLNHLSIYSKSIDTPTFRLLKKCLPGPYTFIFQASKQVPKILQSKRKTIGIRIPNNQIALNIVTTLGNPLLSSSLPHIEEIYQNDPDEIYEIYKNQVDIVINGGLGLTIPSSIIDCTKETIEIVRQGAGDISFF